MPRRRKPPGYEKWTWVEINAGRRMSRSEKRWNRVAKSLEWEQRANGTFQAPPNAAPFLALIVVLMIVLCVLAPNGMQNAKGENAAAAVLVFLMVAVAMMLLVVFGRNEGAGTSHGTPAQTAPATAGRRGAYAPLPRAPAKPILRPALTAFFRATGSVLAFRRVMQLPGWLQPIFWGVMIVAPAVATILRWRLDPTLVGDSAFCLCSGVVGCALGGLIHDGLQTRKESKAAEEAERAEIRERFRRTLARELSTRPQRDFNFVALTAEHAIPRFEADAAAARVYRRFSDRVVQDGVITDDERRRLATLARLLEIGPERVAVIEAAAKSDRFQAAVDDVLADGIVTEEEARELETIRRSLELGNAAWEKGLERIASLDHTNHERISPNG